MKLLAVTVVFHPDPELLLRSVASYVHLAEKVLVWRNSPLSAALEADLKALTADGRIAFRGDGGNAGIPAALNAASREAEAGGFDALLTMDQDSVWHGLEGFLAAVSSPDAPAGFYAPFVNRPPEGEAVGVFTPFETAFTSGMFIPLPVLRKVGGWCEDFKVDGVDNEFCLHALSLGIRGYRVPSGWLEHSLGNISFRRLLGLRFRTYNYAPERLFGIYRNNLITIKKYPSVARKFRRDFYRTWLWRRPLRMLLGEKDLKAKFAAVRRGIRAARKAVL